MKVSVWNKKYTEISENSVAVDLIKIHMIFLTKLSSNLIMVQFKKTFSYNLNNLWKIKIKAIKYDLILIKNTH